MSLDPVQLAHHRATATHLNYMSWLEVIGASLASTRQAGVSEAQFHRLAEACDHPDQLKVLVEALHEHQRENPRGPHGWSLLVAAVDDSPYALPDWVEAIDTFYEWLGETAHHASWESLLRYIGCCAEAAARNPARPALSHVVEEMLANFGYDG